MYAPLPVPTKNSIVIEAFSDEIWRIAKDKEKKGYGTKMNIAEDVLCSAGLPVWLGFGVEYLDDYFSNDEGPYFTLGKYTFAVHHRINSETPGVRRLIVPIASKDDAHFHVFGRVESLMRMEVQFFGWLGAKELEPFIDADKYLVPLTNVRTMESLREGMEQRGLLTKENPDTTTETSTTG